MLQSIKSRVFSCKSKRKTASKPRTVYCTQTKDYYALKDELNKQESMFKDNTIRNTRYTPLNFLPKGLKEQFSLHMNQYFLLLAFLQLWKTITPVNPITTWIPLIVVVGVGMLKEFIDDFSRFRKDREFNSRKVSILRDGGRRISIESKNVRVGDLVLVKENENICADMVVLGTSNEECSCYIETSALDGEEDYKERLVPKAVRDLEINQIYRFHGIIEAPPPNPEINKFDATLLLDDHIISLSEKNLLLQGTFLKNTEWVIGMVVYTGNESKIGMNKQESNIKWTRMDTFINHAVVFVFIFQLLCGIFFGTIGDILRGTVEKAFYLGNSQDYTPSIPSYAIIPLRFVLLCSLMIPQSLKVTSDFCKYILSMMISYDLKLYDSKSDTAAGATNTSICEDLGQIEYLFTDKTGTLTENVMIFRKCIIDSNLYNANSDKLLSDLRNNNEKLSQFMDVITLCNTVSSTLNDLGEICYRSHSPDEEALVQFAKESGIILLHRDHESVKLQKLGNVQEYKILNVLEFSSNRRRMSIIVQPINSEHNENIVLLSKGADDSIFSILKQDSNINKYKENVRKLANEGLRTMCMAFRTVSPDEYEEWSQEYEKANSAMENRAEEVEKVYSLIEHNLQYIGCSGIEDSLQEEVPETIQALRDAGIIVWMLTGDKKETALIIGYSCSLIDRDSTISKGTHLFDIEGESVESISIALQRALQDMQSLENENRAVVIDGNSLKFIFPDHTESEDDVLSESNSEYSREHNMKMFADLTIQCKSVICCRMSPIQKGNIVKMMKQVGSKRRRCLSIGDGGNDVTMILESDVGVGISGKEGLQAVRAADFSIARFKFLKRLLLVHGRNCYRRMAYVSQYTMYKSLILAFSQLLFSIYSAFSGAPLLNTFSLTMYNLVFTSGLPLAFAFDKDVSDEALEHIPELYSESSSNTFINIKTFIMWFIFGAFQALVVVFGVLIIMNGDYIIGATGRTMDYWNEGLVVITIILTIQLVNLILLLRSFTILSVVLTFGSFLVFIITTVIYSVTKFASKSTTMYMAAIHLMQDPNFYSVCFLLTFVASFPLIIYQFFFVRLTSISPSYYVRCKELQSNHKDDSFWNNLRSKVIALKSRKNLTYHSLARRILSISVEEETRLLDS